MTIASNGLDGPNGSASFIEEITFSPVKASIFAIHSSPVPKRVAACKTECVIIGITVAPTSIKFWILGTTSSYVQWEAVIPRPIRFPLTIFFLLYCLAQYCSCIMCKVFPRQ